MADPKRSKTSHALGRITHRTLASGLKFVPTEAQAKALKQLPLDGSPRTVSGTEARVLRTVPRDLVDVETETNWNQRHMAIYRDDGPAESHTALLTSMGVTLVKKLKAGAPA